MKIFLVLIFLTACTCPTETTNAVVVSKFTYTNGSERVTCKDPNTNRFVVFGAPVSGLYAIGDTVSVVNHCYEWSAER